MRNSKPTTRISTDFVCLIAYWWLCIPYRQIDIWSAIRSRNMTNYNILWSERYFPSVSGKVCIECVQGANNNILSPSLHPAASLLWTLSIKLIKSSASKKDIHGMPDQAKNKKCGYCCCLFSLCKGWSSRCIQFRGLLFINRFNTWRLCFRGFNHCYSNTWILVIHCNADQHINALHETIDTCFSGSTCHKICTRLPVFKMSYSQNDTLSFNFLHSSHKFVFALHQAFEMCFNLIHHLQPFLFEAFQCWTVQIGSMANCPAWGVQCFFSQGFCTLLWLQRGILHPRFWIGQAISQCIVCTSSRIFF